jgi:hypothetical protein
VFANHNAASFARTAFLKKMPPQFGFITGGKYNLTKTPISQVIPYLKNMLNGYMHVSNFNKTAYHLCFIWRSNGISNFHFNHEPRGGRRICYSIIQYFGGGAGILWMSFSAG